MPTRLLALLLLTACPEPSVQDSDPPVPTPISCDASCADLGTEAGEQLCYACRCKSAMDGWLPSPDELQCGNGTPIEAYTVGPDDDLLSAEPGAPTCANPSLLYGTCESGGRLGQLTRGDITVKWICRYNEPVAQPGVDPYDDVGAILYNARTGATCWFDDDDGTGIAASNFPNLDLMTSDQANRDAFGQLFYVTQGRVCTSCHDADPFLFTPYLQSADWQTGAHAFGPYRRVTMEGTLAAIEGRHLVGSEVAACTACHRLGSENSCGQWLQDALGEVKSEGHEQAVLDAAGTERFALATWMPPELSTDLATWEATYATARAAITRCCADPSDPTCDWQPIP